MRSSDETSPNILLIVLDDFGYSDLGLNASDAPTPNLDALASEGILYDRHYAQPSCSVARAALLTGNYPSAYGFRPTHLGLSADTPTIASLLQGAGYVTKHIGKWHVGNATEEQSPLSLGFDSWFGFLIQQELAGLSRDGVSYRQPTYRNPWLYDNDKPARQFEGHLTDIITARASRFIAGQAASDQPWFLNLWYFAPHAPIQPAERFSRRHPDTPEGQYLALLDQLDDSIGQVLSTLSVSDQADNTLVVVVSDNGGSGKVRDSNHPFFGRKTELREGGLRTPLLMRWPEQISAGIRSDALVSLYDVLPTLVAAAGASIPEQAIGRDLLASQLSESPRLVWELADANAYMFSILSRDGRWRYSNGTWLPEGLFDLQADPSGATDVLAQHPEVAEGLREDYRKWRVTQREVDVGYKALNKRGGARLSGRDILRSPGYRGFTFAIGVTPKELSGEAQVIASQRDRWSLRASSRATALELQDEILFLPPLPDGVCTEVVVSSYTLLSPIFPKTNKASVEVFFDGETVAEVHSHDPGPNTSAYREPTFIGMTVPGRGEFRGNLSRPLILNERVFATASDPLMQDGIADLPPLCPSDSS